MDLFDFRPSLLLVYALVMFRRIRRTVLKNSRTAATHRAYTGAIIRVIAFTVWQLFYIVYVLTFPRLYRGLQTERVRPDLQEWTSCGHRPRHTLPLSSFSHSVSSLPSIFAGPLTLATPVPLATFIIFGSTLVCTIHFPVSLLFNSARWHR